MNADLAKRRAKANWRRRCALLWEERRENERRLAEELRAQVKLGPGEYVLPLVDRRH